MNFARQEGGFDDVRAVTPRRAFLATGLAALALGAVRPGEANAGAPCTDNTACISPEPDKDYELGANPNNPPLVIEGGRYYVVQGDVKFREGNGSTHPSWGGEERIKRVMVLDGDCNQGTQFDTRNGVDVAEFHYSPRGKVGSVDCAWQYAGHVIALGLTNTGETGNLKYNGVRLVAFNGPQMNSVLIPKPC